MFAGRYQPNCEAGGLSQLSNAPLRGCDDVSGESGASGVTKRFRSAEKIELTKKHAALAAWRAAASCFPSRIRIGRHHFFAATSFRIALSRICSARSFLSRAFSSSRAFRRRTSDTSIHPPAEAEARYYAMLEEPAMAA